MPTVSILNVIRNFINSLTFDEQCIFCLFNSNLSLTQQFHQLLHKKTRKASEESLWKLKKKENDSWFQRLPDNKTVTCPDPRCVLSFDSAQDFQFHCRDVHCVEMQLLHLTDFCIYMITLCWRPVARMRLRKKYDPKEKAWSTIILHL